MSDPSKEIINVKFSICPNRIQGQNHYLVERKMIELEGSFRNEGFIIGTEPVVFHDLANLISDEITTTPQFPAELKKDLESAFSTHHTYNATTKIRELSDLGEMTLSNPDSKITSKDQEETMKKVKEIQIKSGYLSAHFVTNEKTAEIVLENPYFFLCEKKINDMRDFLPLLEKIANSGRPLLVVAKDVEEEALATLIINNLRGTLKCCAIKIPKASSPQSLSNLVDLSYITGAHLMDHDADISVLGSADLVIVNENTTTIIGGGGTQELIKGRILLIQQQIKHATFHHKAPASIINGYEERIAMLSKYVATAEAVEEVETVKKIEKVETVKKIEENYPSLKNAFDVSKIIYIVVTTHDMAYEHGPQEFKIVGDSKVPIEHLKIATQCGDNLSVEHVMMEHPDAEELINQFNYYMNDIINF